MFKKLLLAVATLIATMGFAFAQVDVNKADQAALDSVKGIGPVRSQQIIDERTKGGNFKDWSDFEARIKGIGAKNSVKLSEAGLQVNGQAKPGADAVKPKAPAPAAKKEVAVKEVPAKEVAAKDPAVKEVAAADAAPTDAKAAAAAKKEAKAAAAAAKKEAKAAAAAAKKEAKAAAAAAKKADVAAADAAKAKTDEVKK